MRKIVAVWLLFWMAFMAFGQETVFAAKVSSGNVDPQAQRERMAQIGTNPININHKTNWDTHNIFVLVRNSCGQLSFRDPKTGETKWGRYCLPAGTVLDVSRGSQFNLVKDPQGRQEWENVGVLDLVGSEAVVTACGNVFRPENDMIGKLDAGRECPKCEPVIVEKEVPVVSDLDLCQNLDGIQTRVPQGLVMDENGDCNRPFAPQVVSKRRVWPWLVGALALGALAALAGQGDDEEDCDTCPGRDPYPNP